MAAVLLFAWHGRSDGYGIRYSNWNESGETTVRAKSVRGSLEAGVQRSDPLDPAVYAAHVREFLPADGLGFQVNTYGGLREIDDWAPDVPRRLGFGAGRAERPSAANHLALRQRSWIVTAPWWAAAAAPAAWVGWRAGVGVRGAWWRRANRCGRCGAPRAGLGGWARCTTCDSPPPVPVRRRVAGWLAAASCVLLMVASAAWVRSYLACDTLFWSNNASPAHPAADRTDVDTSIASFVVQQGRVDFNLIRMIDNAGAGVGPTASHSVYELTSRPASQAARRPPLPADQRLFVGGGVRIASPRRETLRSVERPGLVRQTWSAYGEVPLGWPVLVLAVLPALHARTWWRERRERRRASRNHCTRCGYDLRASPSRCPECGLAVGPGESSGQPTASGMAFVL